MLVNSFDTKFAKTAEKYENLDNSFVNLLKKKNNLVWILLNKVVKINVLRFLLWSYYV